MSKAKKSPKGPRIEVCTGSHCRRAGAKKLYQALENLVEATGGGIRLKAADCLDECEAAPVLALKPGKRLCQHVGHKDLPGIVQSLVPSPNAD
jgi:NADH:ubiquinone oxidoreductase subunit E